MTKEPIEEAREHTEQPGSPNINDGQGYCGRCSRNWPCVTTQLADALEAQLAARQPTEDDREALEIAVGRVVRDVMNFPQAVQARLLGQDMSPLWDALVDSVADAGFSRAAVPDAATEELRADELTAEEAVKLVLKRPGMYGLTRTEEFRKVEAERDAALAAVERVRAIHQGQEDPFGVIHLRCRGCNCYWPCRTIAALDGAPEPEWEWGSAHRDDISQGATEYSEARARERVRDWNETTRSRNGVLVRRRKAGPWLPVGGESKP